MCANDIMYSGSEWVGCVVLWTMPSVFIAAELTLWRCDVRMEEVSCVCVCCVYVFVMFKHKLCLHCMNIISCEFICYGSTIECLFVFCIKMSKILK